MRIQALTEEIKVVQVKPPDSDAVAETLYNDTATAASATGIDTKDFDEFVLGLDLRTITSPGTLDISVYESDSAATAAGSSLITGAAFAQKVSGVDGMFLGRIKTKNTKRYLYVKTIKATASAKKFGVFAILGRADAEKVSQDETLGFDV